MVSADLDQTFVFLLQFRNARLELRYLRRDFGLRGITRLGIGAYYEAAFTYPTDVCIVCVAKGMHQQVPDISPRQGQWRAFGFAALRSVSFAAPRPLWPERAWQ